MGDGQLILDESAFLPVLLDGVVVGGLPCAQATSIVRYKVSAMMIKERKTPCIGTTKLLHPVVHVFCLVCMYLYVRMCIYVCIICMYLPMYVCMHAANCAC